MSNIMKINIFAERRRIKGRIINIKNFEENISNYNSWLKKNNREDRIKNYEEFLQIQ